MIYQADDDRYTKMPYVASGRSGLRLPKISLGMWHNFGSVDHYENARAMAHTAFDLGITHFDLANNYGPEPGSAEITMGRLLRDSFAPYRDEMIISSKAGYLMWPGPYGEWGSRKSLIASCDQSLKRMNIDYVDIFYHHRPDGDTPIEESMLALDHIVRSGRALYVGLSNYNVEQTRAAIAVLRANKTPYVIQQMRCNMFDRTHQKSGLFDMLADEGVGAIIFSPLAQGMLTSRYLNGIPADSRAVREHFLKTASITPQMLKKVEQLNAMAAERGQTLAQMAIAWLLQMRGVTSALIGASKPEQITDIVRSVEKTDFTAGELALIDKITLD